MEMDLIEFKWEFLLKRYEIIKHNSFLHIKLSVLFDLSFYEKISIFGGTFRLLIN